MNNKQPIYLFFQYFISSNKERQSEIDSCLELNILNKNIDKIILLNEKIYDNINNDKVLQVNINKRLTYLDCIKYANQNLPEKSIFIIINSDIFFANDAIEKIIDYKTKYPYPLALSKYNISNDLSNYELHNNIEGSQDCWVLQTPVPENTNLDISLGIIGCENHFAYLLFRIYKGVLNPCHDIITFHLHTSNFRTYNETNRVMDYYCFVFPPDKNNISRNVITHPSVNYEPLFEFPIF